MYSFGRVRKTFISSAGESEREKEENASATTKKKGDAREPSFLHRDEKIAGRYAGRAFDVLIIVEKWPGPVSRRDSENRLGFAHEILPRSFPRISHAIIG